MLVLTFGPGVPLGSLGPLRNIQPCRRMSSLIYGCHGSLMRRMPVPGLWLYIRGSISLLPLADPRYNLQHYQMSKYRIERCGVCSGSGFQQHSSPFHCENCDGKRCYLCENTNRSVYRECSRCMGLGTIWFDRIRRREVVIFSEPASLPRPSLPPVRRREP